MSLFQPAPEPVSELAHYRILSSTAGIRVSPFQLGAMSIGDAWSGFMGGMTKEQAFELLDTYVEARGKFIDTANDYQCGQSETWLGEWMVARQNREQPVIMTKFTNAYTAPVLGNIGQATTTAETTSEVCM
ncbi:NADP-dependent oxidoreductase domain-containing protein [Aspergillus insuetus]